tara:strand:+ start:3631 stop:5586 length:1956 start_codon:yes stop_codon:yes gene_type:complete
MADRKNNPRNPGSELFKRLTRLFSGPIVNRRVQMYRQQRRRDLDKYKFQFKSTSGLQFKKSTYNPFDVMQTSQISNQNRAERYMDFDQMEYTPEIASSLDIYADEMTTNTHLQPMLRIECQNEEIKTILTSLYNNVLNINFNLFGWSRTMCKYGDFFLYLDIDEEDGIKNVIGLPPQEIERMEGEDPTNPNYVQFQWNSGGMTFENWQVAHFRILGNDKYSPYGTSVLEPARRIWRQLVLLEDAMMAYRVVRSPERRVFYIDVGNIAPQDVEQYMQRVMTQMKRNQIVDAQTGRVDLRYNPLSVEEDYFMPVRGDSSSKIESLPGGTFTGDIDDVKYLRDKLFSALKVPQSYLSRGEGADEDKSTLAQKDIRFARTIQRLQRSVLSEIEKVGIIHLYTIGFRGDDLVSFTLSLNNPSKIAELQELEHWRTKFDVAASATEGFFSNRWISQKVFGLTDDEIVRMQREQFYDRKLQAQLELAGDAASGGGGDAGFDSDGDDMADDDDFDLEDLADDTEADNAEADNADTDEDETLLAVPPARRDSEPSIGELTTTPRSKGKKYKKRGKGGHKAAARRSSYHAHGGRSYAKNTTTNTFHGIKDLSGLANGVFESQDTNYSEDETKIFEATNELKRFAQSLELRDVEKNNEGEAQ